MQTTISPTAASAAQPAAAKGAAAKSNTVDYNGFLQLLIAQLKNQDPTTPTDSTQFVSQLASFSSVEQQVQTNSKLSSLLTSSKLAQADAVIGRTLTSADGSVSGKVVSVTLTDAGARATLDSGKTIDVGDGVSVS